MKKGKIKPQKTEKPFEFLKKKDGSVFSPETYKNWYMARAYVLDKLEEIAFVPDSDEYLHVVVTDVDDDNTRPLMLSVVRQVALTAHYINFEEENPDERKRKRSVITLVSLMSEEKIVAELKKDEYLCNLMDYCKYSVYGSKVVNKDSYIDIEIEIVKEEPQENVKDPNEFFFRVKDVVSFCNSKPEDEIFSIDTRKAVLASRMYDLGAEIDNLPYEDIHSTERYAVAIDVFQFVKMDDEMNLLMDESRWKKHEKQTKVMECLSNLFCSDCFEPRSKVVKLYSEQENIDEFEAWKKLNFLLSKSEHARWVVEKLIMGYKPLDDTQRLEYESQFGANRKQFVKDLKQPSESKELSHIDLCSFSNLRRIDPNNMKYDSFLVLGICEILNRIKKDDKN